MYRPAADGPSVFLNQLWPAVFIDIALALLLGRLQLPPDTPGVALAAIDMAIVDDGDDARLRQIEQPPGDHFVAGRTVPRLKSEHITILVGSILDKPDGWNQKVIS